MAVIVPSSPRCVMQWTTMRHYGPTRRVARAAESADVRVAKRVEEMPKNILGGRGFSASG